MIPTFRPRNSGIAICLFVSARTFRPWAYTSDHSYIYQLSLVVATATVSFSRWLNMAMMPVIRGDERLSDKYIV